MTSPSEPLYTMEQARILGRRAVCEQAPEGHRIVLVMSARLFNGKRSMEVYGCDVCDATVTVSHPELTPAAPADAQGPPAVL